MLPLDQRLEGVALAQAKVAAVVKTPAPAPDAPKSSKSIAKAPAKIAAKVLPKATAPAAVASGAWRAQLGAFSKRASAEALFTKLSGAGSLAGVQPFYVDAGAVTRLQVGPFESRAAATAACAALAKAGQPCFPVQAN